MVEIRKKAYEIRFRNSMLIGKTYLIDKITVLESGPELTPINKVLKNVHQISVSSPQLRERSSFEIESRCHYRRGKKNLNFIVININFDC